MALIFWDTFLILYEEAARSMWLSLHFPFAPLTRIEVGTLLFNRLRPCPRKYFFAHGMLRLSHLTRRHTFKASNNYIKYNTQSKCPQTMHAAAQGRWPHPLWSLCDNAFPLLWSLRDEKTLSRLKMNDTHTHARATSEMKVDPGNCSQSIKPED